MEEELASGLSADEIEKGIDEFLAIGGFPDEGDETAGLVRFGSIPGDHWKHLNATEREREEFLAKQHQANRWTYKLDQKQREKMEAVAPVFC